MNISKKVTTRGRRVRCGFFSCSNRFIKRHHRELFCHDPRCIELRKIAYADKNSAKRKPTVNTNLKIYNGYKTGEMVALLCHAKGCSNTYEILYSKKRKIYPNYCILHRNEYQRERFERLHG